jgi:hypothetical protein
MGNRANFGFRQGNDIVYLYGHWAGERMLDRLAQALKYVHRVNRDSDYIYGTRIAISQLIGDDWPSEFGWGITINQLSDNEHSVPVVDFQNGTVTLYNYDWNAGQITDPKFTTTITKFIERYATSDY